MISKYITNLSEYVAIRLTLGFQMIPHLIYIHPTVSIFLLFPIHRFISFLSLLIASPKPRLLQLFPVLFCSHRASPSSPLLLLHFPLSPSLSSSLSPPLSLISLHLPLSLSTHHSNPKECRPNSNLLSLFPLQGTNKTLQRLSFQAPPHRRFRCGKIMSASTIR